MKSRKATDSERKWMAHTRDLGCVACTKMGYANSPTAIHHMDGKVKPGSHFLTLPLCPEHHQHKDNSKPQAWVSRHGDGRRAFEAEYGTESDLLANVRGRLERMYGEPDWLVAAREFQEVRR